MLSTIIDSLAKVIATIKIATDVKFTNSAEYFTFLLKVFAFIVLIS